MRPRCRISGQAERHVLDSIVAAATHADAGGSLPQFAGARLVAVLAAGAIGVSYPPRAGDPATRFARRRRFGRACMGHLVGLCAKSPRCIQSHFVSASLRRVLRRRLRAAAAPVLLDRSLALLRLVSAVDDDVARRRGTADAPSLGGGCARGASLSVALVVDTMVILRAGFRAIGCRERVCCAGVVELGHWRVHPG